LGGNGKKVSPNEKVRLSEGCWVGGGRTGVGTPPKARAKWKEMSTHNAGLRGHTAVSTKNLGPGEKTSDSHVLW